MPAPDAEEIRRHETALQRAVTVWIVTGLFFMLLPGTFLGAWNLIEITDRQTAADLDPSWLQAHGHAQIFGWIGSFILGIGFYSLSKMIGLARFAIGRCRASWALWTLGVSLRWATNLWQWQWRWMLPLSALLELAGFVTFFLTVRRHRAPASPKTGAAGESRVWMGLVIAGTMGFLMSLAANLVVACQAAVYGASPAIPHVENQRLLAFPGRDYLGFQCALAARFPGSPRSRRAIAHYCAHCERRRRLWSAHRLVASCGGFVCNRVRLVCLGLGWAFSAVACVLRRSSECTQAFPPSYVSHTAGCWFLPA
jgi:hypothetical protein